MTDLPTSHGASTPYSNSVSTPTLETAQGAGASNFRTSVINLDRPGDPSVFDDKTRAEAAEIIARYPVGQSRSALLPMLHLVQSVQGQVTADGIAFCADLLGITKAQVSAVATFYTMYKRTPTGEYLVSVCTNTLCGLLGGDEIFATLKQTLGVGNNGTTGDGLVTLEHAECLAACDYAPVVTVNYEFYDNQTPESATELVGRLQAGERPQPTRGGALCTFREIERQIAGFYDEAALALDANGSGVPTEAGVQLAIRRGDTAPSYAVGADAEDTARAGTTSKGSGARAAERSTGGEQPTSEHDAPLQTSESDSASPQPTQSTAKPEPGGGKGDTARGKDA